MPLHVQPQAGVPLPDDFESEEPRTLSTKAKVAIKTGKVLLDFLRAQIVQDDSASRLL